VVVMSLSRTCSSRLLSSRRLFLAVADRCVLLVGSANLTESGVRRNLEAGVLVTGGTAPQRAAEHIRELQRRGIVTQLV